MELQKVLEMKGIRKVDQVQFLTLKYFSKYSKPKKSCNFVLGFKLIKLLVEQLTLFVLQLIDYFLNIVHRRCTLRSSTSLELRWASPEYHSSPRVNLSPIWLEAETKRPKLKNQGSKNWSDSSRKDFKQFAVCLFETNAV